eukprot:TRINITY_DN1898_c0_g1_i3.p1 TRINITY_DN1898_c0_g1~~TRINITY_DN1898_c0_g1_i3.p1  ORF type:complete len:475 (+),score=235.22 TRINITY_DN1898_c0_g1_i3:112-1536(+)
MDHITTPKKCLTTSADRFISSRGNLDIDIGYYNITNTNINNSNTNGMMNQQLNSNQDSINTNNNNISPSKLNYKTSLAESLFDGKTQCKILTCKTKAPAPKEGYLNNLRVLYSTNNNNNSQNNNYQKQKMTKTRRYIPQSCERTLDAPELVDDYYLNLLDWNYLNLLGVGLGNSVYIWNASSGEVQQLFENEQSDNIITSVSWMQDRNFISIGSNNGQIQLWDVEHQRLVRTMMGHHSRVGALSWNSYILSSGSADGSIFNHDVRAAQHHISSFLNHYEEVCSLKWNSDGNQLASGANDNLLNIWELNNNLQPKFSFDDHNAAVKALAWCPWTGHSNLLASGAGTADRHIRFWNTSTGALINSINTNSQVCSLQWSKNYKEIASSHGYANNSICIWKYPSLVKTAELMGHSARVLHMATSPDGTTIASLGADETLRFWKLFEVAEKQLNSKTKATTITNMVANSRGNFSSINLR